MRIRLINTGQRRVDALLNRMIRKAIRVNKLRDAQKVGIDKRKKVEAGYVAKLQEQFPDLFKNSKRQYKTLKGAADFISKTLQGTEYTGNAELVAQSIKTVGSLERVTKRQAAGLPPLRRFTGSQIDRLLTSTLNEVIGDNQKLRDKIRKSYLESNQWKLHRTWRSNRDELLLSKQIREGVISGGFEPLSTFKKKYSTKTLTANYYSPEIDVAIAEFNKRYPQKTIYNNKRAGFVNIWTSETLKPKLEELIMIDADIKDKIDAIAHMLEKEDIMNKEGIYYEDRLSDLVSP